jgi:hypothetical protein
MPTASPPRRPEPDQRSTIFRTGRLTAATVVAHLGENVADQHVAGVQQQ